MSTDDRDFFVHSNAICESTNIGAGTKIWSFSHVMPGAEIGKDCNIGENVFIENKVKIGNGCTLKNGVAVWDHIEIEDHVFVGPNATFTNDLRPRAFFRGNLYIPTKTVVGRGASIGANATIVCGVKIGEFAMIGSGAVVTRDVPPHSIMVGNPAKIIGRACICGNKLNVDDFCNSCGITLDKNSIEHTISKRLQYSNS